MNKRFLKALGKTTLTWFIGAIFIAALIVITKFFADNPEYVPYLLLFAVLGVFSINVYNNYIE